jgi:hypothetical protein
MTVTAPTVDGPTSGILQGTHIIANPHRAHQVRKELVCHVVPQNIIKLSRRLNIDRRGGANVPREIADGKSRMLSNTLSQVDLCEMYQS